MLSNWKKILKGDVMHNNQKKKKYRVKGILFGQPFENTVAHISGCYAIKRTRLQFPAIGLMTAELIGDA